MGWEDVTKTKPNKKSSWPIQTNNIALCVHLTYDYSTMCIYFFKKAKTNNTHTKLKRKREEEHLQPAGNLPAISLRSISIAACSLSACHQLVLTVRASPWTETVPVSRGLRFPSMGPKHEPTLDICTKAMTPLTMGDLKCFDGYLDSLWLSLYRSILELISICVYSTLTFLTHFEKLSLLQVCISF